MPGTQQRKPKRNVNRHAKRAALVGAAAITVAALTAGSGPAAHRADAPPRRPALRGRRSLSRARQIPDLTGGLGTAGYDLSQAIAAAILQAITNNINLMALARAAGMDPPTLLQSLPPNLLRGVLDTIPLDLSPLLSQPRRAGCGGRRPRAALSALGITDGAGFTTVTQVDWSCWALV